MQLIMHDYGGYPFTRQLALNLARRGHSVEYIYSESTQMIRRVAEHAEQANLRVTPIGLDKKFSKYALWQRREGESEHGKKVVEEIRRFQAEVVFSADTPLDAQGHIVKACDPRKTKFVFWMQDAIGLATRRILAKKMPIAGWVIGRYYEGLERRMVRQSDKVIVNSEDFLPLMKQWKVREERIRVIHNWAPLDELPVQPKQNPWAQRHKLDDKFCFVYTGILGFKHNPELFIQLAREFQVAEDVRVVVIAEGEAARWLSEEKEKLKLRQLVVLPYQPAEEYAQVLGAGEVLISILNPEAGAYSVPSKVLSYLCARRPLLLSMPVENLAARIVAENKAGWVCAPGDARRWLENARGLYEDRELRERMGENGRRWAEKNFEIEQITDRFEEIIDSCWKN